MDATAVNMPAAAQKKRFGLVPARIGASFAHKIGVAMPIEPPQYATTVNAPGAAAPRARTRVDRRTPVYEYEKRPDGTMIPIKALPGATVYLEVQDISRLEPELVEQVQWCCQHPDCAGTRHETKDELVRSHDDNRKLQAEAERDPNGGRAHLFMGILELAGVAEKKDDKSGKVTPAQPPVVMLLSDTE